ncbi:Hypothetical Protein OBI_RACECAR_41 [Arthrobacter phage Racecar]|nr:hypothetical protein PBI_RACECAR_122 [Arthrobacter phage Racecar]QFG12797.1 hypothetical protein PBI_MIMI_119 [Arthrobacter phage Mimi]
MDQVTSVTGKRHVFSTAGTRRRARTRAARLGAFERRVERAASDMATGVRSGTVRALQTRVGAGVLMFGALTLGSVHDFKLPF